MSVRVKRRSLCFYMPNGGIDGVIQAWQPGNWKWVEFRGPPYHKWGDSQSPMQRIHDAMEGMHATVLHQYSILLIHEEHKDFERVWQIYMESQ